MTGRGRKPPHVRELYAANQSQFKRKVKFLISYSTLTWKDQTGFAKRDLLAITNMTWQREHRPSQLFLTPTTERRSLLTAVDIQFSMQTATLRVMFKTELICS